MKQSVLLVAILSYLPYNGHTCMILLKGKDSITDHMKGLATHFINTTRLFHLIIIHPHIMLLIPSLLSASHGTPPHPGQQRQERV